MSGTEFQHRGSWPVADIVGAGALMALAFIVTWDAWEDMHWIATRNSHQSHVMLVPAIAAWLTWVRRGRLRRCPRDGRLIGPAFVVVGWLLFSLGDLALIQSFWHLGAITVVVGGFLSFAGSRYLTRLLPAFVVLGFMVPVPGVVRQQIALPIQMATADATLRVLELLGAEGSRMGNILTINGLDFLVSSGPRMVFALVLVSYAFAYTMPIRDPVRILIMLLSPLTAVVCNVLHLAPSVWVYAYVSKDAGSWIHAIGGWLIMPAAFLLLLGIFRALRWASVPVYRYTLAYGK